MTAYPLVVVRPSLLFVVFMWFEVLFQVKVLYPYVWVCSLYFSDVIIAHFRCASCVSSGLYISQVAKYFGKYGALRLFPLAHWFVGVLFMCLYFCRVFLADLCMYSL